MKTLSLTLPAETQRYDITFYDTFEALEPALKSQIGGRKFIIVTDQNVVEKSPFMGNDFDLGEAACVSLKPGEEEKTWESVKYILDAAFDAELDRSSVIVAIGGGVIGDMAGFAASVFMRGVPVIQVPTTLLSMVDSSVGGKTGFDCQYGKNLVGAFHQPEAVLCCPAFLETLPEIEVQNGIGEMVKHGIIASPDHFQSLSAVATEHPAQNLESLSALIPDSIQIKKDIVEADQKEAGIRGYLNLGHTFGHAIEHLSNFEMPHGRAVAIGCLMAAQYSLEQGLCDEALVDQIEDIFNRFGVDLTCEFSEEAIVEAMLHDKKKQDGNIRLILPKKIGEVEYFTLRV